ncbi:MAG: SprB repeat-containing protein, partial [Saprospiraceae bacterium]|nr:SprB repeat-containing protein [Saprospiraceae bacterium]
FWDQEPGGFISAPGTYTFTSTPYQSYLGCDSTVRQKIIAKQRKFKILPPTWLCKDECLQVGDFEFCENGTFTEALTAADGCDSMVTFTIIKIPAKAGIKKPDTLTCREPTVVLSADSTITTGNTVTYKWVNAAGTTLSTTTSVTVNNAGPFYFIVTNFGGGKSCSDTAVVTVPVNQTPPISNAGPNRVLTCETPLIQLQGSGSTGPQFTYLWLAFNGGNIVSGATTLTPTVNATGTYRLRVTNQINGCTATDNTLVTASQLPPTLSATGGTYNCTNTTVTLQTTTGANGPTYAWTGPNNFSSTQANPTVSTAGEYTVVVTDSVTGCTNSALAIVIANTTPPGAAAVGGVLTCVEDTVQLAGSSPAGSPVFAWSGPGGFTSNQANPVVSATGNYLLTVTGANGCTSTATAVVIRDTVPPGASIAISGNLNCKNATVNLTASSTAPGTFLDHLWTRPNGTTTATGTNPVFSAATPGQYSVLITNTENGCTSTANATVVQQPPVTAGIGASTNVSCFGQQNGSATATGGGGNGSYAFQWNTGDNTAAVSGLSTGTYTVTVSDGEGCTASATVSITQPPTLTANVSATPQMANGQNDGTASASPSGGTPGYTYLWSNAETTATINNLLPGSYTVTVTDANGCTAVAIATVNAYDCTIDADVDASDALCFEANNGTATVVTTAGLAPFTFAWSTGDTTATINGLAPGVYTVVVTDAANCPEAIAFTISEPSLLRANVSATNLSGPSTGDGSASSNPTGGTAPYTFLWSNAETTATINNLDAGTYTVTVTDANGCSVVRMVEVLAGNCGVTLNFITAGVKCNGQSNGAATAIINGGTGPFSYLWSSGDTTATAPMLAAGTHTVTITDALGCEVFDEVTITQPPALSLMLDTVIP